MKKWASVLTVVATLLFSPLSFSETKVAFVDVLKVAEQSPQYEEAKKRLEREFSRRNEELIAEQKQLDKLEDKLTKDGAVMSEAEMRRLEKDVISKRRSLKNSKTEFREDFALRQNEELHKLRQRVAEVVKAVAKER